MEQFDYDLFVIGAGSAGVRACRVAANLGAKVAVAEERYFGGTCVNVGCVPKKLFSYAAHYKDHIEDAKGFGWSDSQGSFDWSILLKNKDNEINKLNAIYKTILEENRVKIYKCRATVHGSNQVLVNGKVISARYILLAVGGWPWVPEFEGSNHAITSNDLFHLASLPDSLVVVGGGYIAVEFATIFSRLGCKTTLIYRRDLLLRGFDYEVREFITTEIGRQLTLKTGIDIQRITPNNNSLVVKLSNGSNIKGDSVLYATGRHPMTADLGLENVDVELSPNGAISVDKNFRTGEPSIYAIGDVIDRVALTPVALAEGEIVVKSLFSETNLDMSYKNIPTTVFSLPSLGTVGLTENEAVELDLDVDIYTTTVNPLKHSLSGREEPAMLKLVVDRPSDRVIGLHMVGPDAGELVQGFAVAMNCGATKTDFDNTVGIHPTLAEEFVTMRTKRKPGIKAGSS